LWLLVLSCIVYGVAFDFFNVSGGLYVDQETTKDHRRGTPPGRPGRPGRTRRCR
ncbi:MAG: nucleoside permease, partial [Oscillospiraceae bacterium]|nr:nucleoside permease [Oscillospiraceae bacterium]